MSYENVLNGGKMNIDQEVYIDKKFTKGFTIHTNTEHEMNEVVNKLKPIFGASYFKGLNYKRPNKELAEKDSLLAGCFWYEMPEYKVNEKQLDRYSFMLYYDKQNTAINEKLTKIFGVPINPVSTFAWFPAFPEDLTEQSKTKMYITDEKDNKTKYPIYIISKGRWEKRHTSRYLDWAEIPYKIVVEPQEKQNYIDSGIPESKILILPKEYLGLNQGGIPARNFVWNHSVSIGAKRHWILDDNIRGYYRLNNNQRTLVKGGVAFKVVEDYVDRFENIKMAGHNYAMFGVATFLKPLTKNTRIYSSILISNDLKDILDEKWRGRYNEDVDLSIRVLKKGYATCLFNALLAGKLATMTTKGGNTDTIYSEGAYEDAMKAKVEHLRKQHPDIVKVYKRFGRTHHLVYYEGFKDIEYKMKPSVKLTNKVDNFGMRLVPKVKIPSLTGGDYFDDDDFEDMNLSGGDIDWWGIAKDIGSDLYNQGKDFISKLGETEEQKEARIKKEEACKLCNEGKTGSGISANSGFYRTDPKRFKGGKLYAKDKYDTGEKQLTPVEKSKVKKKFGESNPEIAEIVEDPMGDDDIKKYFPNAKILKYSELKNYTDITQLLPKQKSFFFLLYERTLNVGHWVLVSRYKDNGIDTIEFFCSYGSKIDAPLSWTPIGMRVQLGEDKPYLSMLLDKSKFRVIYNPVQYQSKKSNVATCGAYDTLRASELVKHNTTLDEFTEMLEEVKKATGLSYDEIVANLVDLR